MDDPPVSAEICANAEAVTVWVDTAMLKRSCGMIAAFEPYTHRFEIALARVTPHLDPNVRELRLALAKDMVNRVIGQPDGPVHAWLEIRAPGADEELPERLIDFLTGAFSASSDNKP